MSSVVLVLTDSKVIAYKISWRRQVYVIDEVQLDGDLTIFFEKLSSKHRCFCCRLIIDRSDEEYVLDQMPSIQASKAKPFIALKAARHFDSNAITTGMLVDGSGGEPRGRMICVGIDVKNSMQVFMQSVEQSGIVLERIDSLSLLLAHHCGVKDLRTKVLLVLSSQDSVHWRFSLIQSGKLLMSRSVSLAGVNRWIELVAELQRTQDYAGSLIDSQRGIRVLYAGPSINNAQTGAGKLVQSLSCRYPLFDSECLYESVISKSNYVARRLPSYVWKTNQSAYLKYMALNSALFVGFVSLLAVSCNFYFSLQTINHFSVKKQELELSIANIEELLPTVSDTKYLSNFALTDLQQLLDLSWTPSFYQQAQELQYRIALVLTEYPSIGLLGISFDRELQSEREDTLKTTAIKNTRMTASFSPKSSDVTARDIEGFLSALEGGNITMLERTGLEVGIDNKGELNADLSGTNPVISEFSVVIALMQETDV